MLTVGEERIRYNTPSPMGDAPVSNGVVTGDANKNKDGGGAIVRSIGGYRGGRFYGWEEENNDGNGGGGDE